jgi:hypothetical protein
MDVLCIDRISLDVVNHIGDGKGKRVGLVWSVPNRIPCAEVSRDVVIGSCVRTD